jgi:pyridoxal phosphate enzyme (YggS family)
MSHSVAEGLEQVQERIQKACRSAGRDPADVTLVAISKMKPSDDIRAAYDEGQIHFGENRAKELQDKMEELDDLEDLQWHMVGTLQTNKIKYMVERVNWIDSIPKKKSLREIEKRASRIDRVINTLVQVNISRESQKSGCDPDDLPEILEYAQDLDHVRVRGLMGMAEFVSAEEQEKVRPEFRMLRELREKNAQYAKGSVDLEHLSMGMTNDMEVAIDEGATIIRVGRAIFGERDYG